MKKIQKVFGKLSGFSLLGTREAARLFGKEERVWTPPQNKPPGGNAPDEELIDTLIAISVVAKRLAEKFRKQMEKEKAFRCSPL